MSPIMKLCGVLAVFALSVMANPLINEANERTRLSDQDLQPGIDVMNDGEVTADQSQATTAESNSIPPEMEVASQTTAGEPNLSTQQANEPTSEAASQTTIAELSTIYAKTDVPIVKVDGEGEEGSVDTTPSPGAPTTQPTGTTTVKANSSSLTSPNKVMGVAALLTLLYYVKFYETY